MAKNIETKISEKSKLVSVSVPVLDESGLSSGAGFVYRHVSYGRYDGILDYDLQGNLKCLELEKEGYKTNQRNFGDIKKLFSEDYKKFDFLYKDEDGVYIGFEHCNAKSSNEELKNKKCNITILPNLEARLNGKDVLVMGSSIGHTHPLNLEVQELYEFHGYGAMVIDRPDEKRTDFVLIKPRGKVVVPGRCNMTIYNLGTDALETHDFANPKQNESNKKLQTEKGPIFCIYSDKKNAFFKFNQDYSEKDNKGDLLISCKIEELIESFEKPRGDLKEGFARIGVNLYTCNEIPLPAIQSIDSSLDFIVENKPQEFISLFKI